MAIIKLVKPPGVHTCNPPYDPKPETLYGAGISGNAIPAIGNLNWRTTGEMVAIWVAHYQRGDKAYGNGNQAIRGAIYRRGRIDFLRRLKKANYQAYWQVTNIILQGSADGIRGGC
jgi:hypothetical protein